MLTDNEILQKRAIKTAIKPKVITETNKDLFAFLQFKLIKEEYAIDYNLITEVFSLRDITPIPGTPPYIMGVVSRKGRIICIVNLKILFGIKQTNLTEMNKVISIRNGDNEFGIVADSIDGITEIDLSLLSEPPGNIENKEKFLQGVMPNGLIVINGINLITNKKLCIE